MTPKDQNVAAPSGAAAAGGSRREFRGTGLYWSLLFTLIVSVAILIGIIQNFQIVEIKYLGWDLHTPLIVVLLVTIFASVVVSVLVGVSWRRRRRRQLTEREELRELRGRNAPTASESPSPAVQSPPPPPPPAPR